MLVSVSGWSGPSLAFRSFSVSSKSGRARSSFAGGRYALGQVVHARERVGVVGAELGRASLTGLLEADRIWRLPSRAATRPDGSAERPPPAGRRPLRLPSCAGRPSTSSLGQQSACQRLGPPARHLADVQVGRRSSLRMSLPFSICASRFWACRDWPSSRPAAAA